MIDDEVILPGAFDQWAQATVRGPERNTRRRRRLRNTDTLQRLLATRESDSTLQLESLRNGNSSRGRHNTRPAALHSDNAISGRFRGQASRELVCAEAAQGVEAGAQGLGIGGSGARDFAVESGDVVFEHS